MVGEPNDPLEAEADDMADKVMRMPEQHFIQRKCAHCEEEEKKGETIHRQPLSSFIQRKESGSTTVASEAISNKLTGSRGTGSSIDGGTRSFMENRFGADFSDVKIHTGDEAIQMNRELSAKAFTVGNDIYFNEGQYQPGSDRGRHLLAHELTHTIQQNDSNSIQRSCFDGHCDTCAGGRRRLTLTMFFRIRATRTNMAALRREIADTRTALANCCTDLSVFFNWNLLRGGEVFDQGVPRAPGSADGPWDFPNDAETLGEGNTFSRARGIPVLVVDEVPGTGGGVTVSNEFDRQFTGTPYVVVGINQPGGLLPATLAHELGHRAGILTHTDADPDNIMFTGATVDEPFCNAIRAIAT